LLERQALGRAQARRRGAGRDRRERLVVILRAADAVNLQHAAANVAADVDRNLPPVGAVHLLDGAVVPILRIPAAARVDVPVVAALADRREAGLVVAVGLGVDGAAYFRREHVGAIGPHTFIRAAP